MAQDPEQSDLIRLIEAGHLLRRQLAAPLAGTGLELGDDAVLLALAEQTSHSDLELTERLGISDDEIRQRLARLAGLGLITRTSVAGEGLAGAHLTEAGAAVRIRLLKHWKKLERDALGPKRSRHRKWLRRRLKRVVGDPTD